jgi:hypothetical protein
LRVGVGALSCGVGVALMGAAAGEGVTVMCDQSQLPM